MNREHPFDSIESAHEFVALCAKVVLGRQSALPSDSFTQRGSTNRFATGCCSASWVQ